MQNKFRSGTIVFRMTGRYVAVVFSDAGDIGLGVARRVDNRLGTHLPLAVVHIRHEDRYVSLQRDVIEAFFPILGTFARAFGGNRDLEAFILVEHLGNLVGYRRAFAAVHRHATHTFEQEIEGEEEPVFLHQETSRHPDRGVEEFAYDKIPVACMGGDADDAFRQLEALARSGLPSEPFQDSLA